MATRIQRLEDELDSATARIEALQNEQFDILDILGIELVDDDDPINIEYIISLIQQEMIRIDGLLCANYTNSSAYCSGLLEGRHSLQNLYNKIKFPVPAGTIAVLPTPNNGGDTEPLAAGIGSQQPCVERIRCEQSKED